MNNELAHIVRRVQLKQISLNVLKIKPALGSQIVYNNNRWIIRNVNYQKKRVFKNHDTINFMFIDNPSSDE